MTKIYVTALLPLLIFAACKSPQKIYDRGDFVQAVERSVKKLQKDPGDAQSKKVLQNAYADAVAQREAEIRNLLNTTSESRYEQVLRQYNSLQNLYYTISGVPAAARAVQPANYASYISTYRDKAAEGYLERGNRWMQEGTKNGFKEAYLQFRAAQELKPDDGEIQRLAKESYRAALTVVLVLPMDAYGSNYRYSNASFQLRTFQDRLIRQLNNSTRSDFIQYITEWDAQSRNLRPDQIMEMRLGRMRFGQPFDRNESYKVQKDVVVKETVFSKDSVVKEYKTVYATINTTRRTLISEAGLLMTSRDEGGRIIWQDEFEGQHRWETKFVTYTGDERALSEKDKQLIENNEPGNQRMPREDEVVDELLRQIQNDLASRLQNHYRRNF